MKIVKYPAYKTEMIFSFPALSALCYLYLKVSGETYFCAPVTVITEPILVPGTGKDN